MTHRNVLSSSILLSLLFITAIWQISERQLSDLLGNLCYKLFKSSFTEQPTWDDKGIAMRYIPGIGKVYDVELIARQASRGYDTHVDPIRLSWFMKGTDWLSAHLDSTAVIYQPYDYPPAQDQAPWLSASAQSSATLAMLKRAGFERDKALLAKGIMILRKLEPTSGQFTLSQPDSSLWFVSHRADPYSLYGMISTLSDLNEIHSLLKDPITNELYQKGMRSLTARLPQLAPRGYLHDNYLYQGRRSQHYRLSKMLSALSATYPDPAFSALVKDYARRQNSFVLWQLVQNPSLARWVSFFLSWLILALIIYLFLRRPVRNFTSEEG